MEEKVQFDDSVMGHVSIGTLAEKPVASPPSNPWSRVVPFATVLGFAVPAVAYLWMIHAYGINIIFLDQWNDVALIGHAYSGTLHLSTLWSQHNENRIFFPNLVVLALAYATHFNVVTEEYLSALMLFGTTALVICAHKRRSPERRWIWYCPVGFLLLSLAQAGNALWGFQLAWYLVLLTTALALFLLDSEPLSWPLFGVATGAAVIASFSSLQGLLVWPAGLLLIYLRRRAPHLAVAWIGSAVLTGVIYFIGYNFQNSQAASQDHLVASLTFFVRVVGDILGESHPGVQVTILGTVLIVTAIWTLVRFSREARNSSGGRPFALSLIFFGLIFSGLTTLGRSGPGVPGLLDLEYRYTVFTIFVLVGLYLAVLDPPVASEVRSSEPPAPDRSTAGQRLSRTDPLFAVARAVVGIAIVLTVIFGSENGIAQARAVHQVRLYTGLVTVRANQYPDGIVAELYSGFESAQWIRREVTIARDHHLSLFATGDAARYLSARPLGPFPPPTVVWVLPRSGSTLHGEQVFDVLVKDLNTITKVDYVLIRPGLEAPTLIPGRRTAYGWIARWNTSTVPNGGYAIYVRVSDSAGRSVRTPQVTVRVVNVHRTG